MMVSGFLVIFGVGCGGGVVGEIGHWWNLRESVNLPAYLRSPFYWIVTVIMILAGGLLAALYGTKDQNAILVLNIGLSAPLIIKALAQANPVDKAQPKSPIPLDPEPTMLNFLRGK